MGAGRRARNFMLFETLDDARSFVVLPAGVRPCDVQPQRSKSAQDRMTESVRDGWAVYAALEAEIEAEG